MQTKKNKTEMDFGEFFYIKFYFIHVRDYYLI